MAQNRAEIYEGNFWENFNKKKIIAISFICAIVISFYLYIEGKLHNFLNNKNQLVLSTGTHNFEHFTLDNGLQAIVINNQNLNQSEDIVALSLPVGYLHENSTQGISRFLQAMALPPSGKQPDEINLLSFVQSNYGFFNSFTTFQETNLYFSVDKDSLYKALEYLAAFLKPHNFSRVDEKQQLIVENYKFGSFIYSSTESLIIYQNSNPKNSLRKIGIKGKTLFTNQSTPEQFPKEAEIYLQQFQSANRIKLVIFSSNQIEALKQKIEQELKDIPIRGKEEDFQNNEIPYGKEECQKIFFIESQEKRSELNIF